MSHNENTHKDDSALLTSCQELRLWEHNWRASRKTQSCIFQFLLVGIALVLAIHPGSTAAEIPKPSGEVLLMISGNISNTNHADGAAFDLQMLEAMPATSFATKTDWTEGLTRFTGVKLSEILEAVGSKTWKITMTAEDGYIYELEREIDSKYPVIIAYKKNDEYMSLRNLGPLWLMFPFDDYPELYTEENRAASIWQLTHMEMH